jgi:hypothetical protein
MVFTADIVQLKQDVDLTNIGQWLNGNCHRIQQFAKTKSMIIN